MKKKSIIISAAAVIAVCCFIFSNSFKVPEETHADSGRIINLIYPFLSKFIGIAYDDLNFIVRKSAHVIEFSWLGISVSSLLIFIAREYGKNFISAGLLFIMSAGLTDEFIQSFTGRTSSVRDVFIDFAGGCLGVLFVFAVNKIVKNVKDKKI